MAQSSSTSTSSSPLSQEVRVRTAAQQLMKITERRIALYQPYPKQLRFHQAGKDHHERVMLAGNQLGKTTSGGAEAAYHLTGLYPKWWKGLRFQGPIRMWASGPTNRKTRDVVQTKLLGKRGRYGTGMIPKASIAAEPTMSRGLAGLVDTVEVKHVAGGVSTLQFMSYDMDQDAWASDTLHLIWFDEEPPQPLYDEGLARLTATGGSSYITVTPLNGMTDVMTRFYPRPDNPDRHTTMMGIRDAKHIQEAEIPRILARYPIHERTARAEGIPILGSGLVYTTPEEAVRIPAFEVPKHFARLIGLDIGGGDHPTAFVDLAWDRDNDVVYVIHAYRVRDPRISVHASAIRHRGAIPVAWPHDASSRSRGDGRTFAQMYRDEGCKMLPTHAQHEDGTNQLEPGISKVATRLQEGRLRVFEHLVEWFEEYRMYHRKDGLIVKERDDLMCATRYGIMMLKHAGEGQARIAHYPEVVGMDYDPTNPGVAEDRDADITATRW